MTENRCFTRTCTTQLGFLSFLHLCPPHFSFTPCVPGMNLSNNLNPVSVTSYKYCIHKSNFPLVLCPSSNFYNILSCFVYNTTDVLSLFREAHDEFQIVANSWRYSNDYSSELFFVMVDIDEGGVEAFQQVKIMILSNGFV